jgi:hypothetical protein
VKIIVGSRDLWPTPNLASAVLSIMVSTDEDFAIRWNKQDPSSAIETMVNKIGERIGRTVVPFRATEGGSAAGYFRDVKMCQEASEVFAFFAPDKLMQGGTGHVAICALRQGLPVHAFELDDDGNVTESASDEGDLVEAWTRWE